MLAHRLPQSQPPRTPTHRIRRLIQQPALLSRRIRRTAASHAPPLPAAFPAIKTGAKEHQSHNRHANRFCVALLNETADEDVVVVTALDAFPFCCHADLMLMPRGELEDVVRVLNSRLPAAFCINVNANDADLRDAIEVLVGLRPVSDASATPALNVRLRDLASLSDSRSPEPPLGARTMHSTLRIVHKDFGERNNIFTREDSAQADSPADVNMYSLSTPAEIALPRSKKRRISPPILSYDWSPSMCTEDQNVDTYSRLSKRVKLSSLSRKPRRDAECTAASSSSEKLAEAFTTLSLTSHSGSQISLNT